MSPDEWRGFRDRLAHIAKIGTLDYGLTVGIHAHAAGFMDFEPELERLLSEVDESLLKICFDTGHHSYAGFDPVAFMRRHMGRISYIHFKDIDPKVKAQAVTDRTNFYKACGQGIFCNLGQGDVDFAAVRALLMDKDLTPNWQYKTVSDVPQSIIVELFTSPWAANEHPLRELGQLDN